MQEVCNTERLVMLTQEEISTLAFSRKDERIAALLELIEKIDDLRSLSYLGEWDQNTQLPDGAGETRGNQMATLQGVMHDYQTNPRLGELLDELQERVKGATYTDADRGLVYQCRRMYEQATKLPRALVEELARVAANSYEAWRRARERNDFASFAPWLTRTVELQ